jgi:hypothetical protein
MKIQGQPNLSKGIQLPFSGDDLLRQYSFISLKNGAQNITAIKSDFTGGNGGATSLNTSGVKLFNAGQPNPQGTVSFQGQGTKFFSTPTADTAQTVSVSTQGGAGTLKVTQNAATTNRSLTSRLYNLTTAQLLTGAGVIGAGILLIVFLRK